MSDEKKSTTPAKSDAKPAAKADAKSGDSAAASSGGETGKSARESVGGAAVGHYGFFSNIKTPEYKSGWDDIWGKKKKSGGKKATAGKAPAKKAATKRKEPRVVSFDFEDLPADLQAGLADAARAQLKKMRINYDNRDKAGAVSWQISCEVKR